MTRGFAGDLRLPVLVVVGTRPEAIKLVPIIVALRESRSFVPVLVRSVLRQLTERRGWAKTDREPIAEHASAAPADPA